MSGAPSTETAQQSIALIERLGRLARTLRHADGLKPVQWEALRYLSRANRYSRNPGALSEFLSSTRGTVSQTLITLEKKGLITRKPNTSDGRGTVLSLTETGWARVAEDPLVQMEATSGLTESDYEALNEKLSVLLRDIQVRNKLSPFGICHTCVHFKGDASEDESGGPHQCGLTSEALNAVDADYICRLHASKSAQV